MAYYHKGGMGYYHRNNRDNRDKKEPSKSYVEPKPYVEKMKHIHDSKYNYTGSESLKTYSITVNDIN